MNNCGTCPNCSTLFLDVIGCCKRVWQETADFAALAQGLQEEINTLQNADGMAGFDPLHTEEL